MAVKPLLWIAAGGIAAGLLLLVRQSDAASNTPPEPPTPPSPTYGETTRVTLSVPAGWRRATNAEVAAHPELVAHATALLNTPGFSSMTYGTLDPFVANDGKTYATWIEQHYHEPGGPTKPWGLHHGVTLLARVDGTLQDEWSLRIA
jgi:hypothetical protein